MRYDVVLTVGSRSGVWQESATDRVVINTTSTRGMLSIYSTFCIIYITLQAAFWPSWPELGTKVLPWF